MNFTLLTNELSKYEKNKIVFVGLGNELRADDGAGIEFVEKLKSKKEFINSHFIIAGRNPENHLQAILNHKPQAVVFIDAAESKSEPGEVKIFSEDEITQAEFSTHTFSITMIKDFLLNHRQMDFMFIGIQPYSTNFQESLTELVKTKLHKFFSSEA